jgi:hypothetical protein
MQNVCFILLYDSLINAFRFHKYLGSQYREAHRNLCGPRLHVTLSLLLNPEDGPDTQFRNVGKKLSVLAS